MKAYTNTYLSVCLSIYLYIYLSVYLSLYKAVYIITLVISGLTKTAGPYRSELRLAAVVVALGTLSVEVSLM